MLYLIIIVLVCLLYIHIKYYIEYTDTDNIYKLSLVSSDSLNKITYLKNPVTFKYIFNSDIIQDKINIIDISNNYTELFLPKNKAMKLLKASNYYSKYNVITNKINDTLFKPVVNVCTKYDMLFGYKDITTRLCSEYAYRTILVVVSGSVDIVLVHPKYSNILNEQLNCKHLVRESNFNIWENTTLKSETLNLEKDSAISVPMYWWWSIKFGDKAKVFQYKYYTYMNKVVILPILAQIWLNN